ncbi:hypothetical protein MMC17_006699 [Xylographa soralifera]|nr:hypothetical protein [Xylographa soralifera]
MAQHGLDSSASYKPLSDLPPQYEATEVGSPQHSRRTSRIGRSFEILNESSPLISPQRLHDDESLFRRDSVPLDALNWTDGGVEESKSIWYLFVLALSIGGLQIAWSVELSNGSPYLLSLGMSKSLLALVWIAGPLSGTLVQPYVGMKSDSCRLPWGKRKPFMVAGAAATIASLIALAWTREIVRGILGIFGADPKSEGVKVTAICFAIFFVYVLDFAINTIQAAIRAFIVDNAPTHQQEDANAMAGRITGFGNILGYLSGYVKLPEIMPFFGDSQFKVLCVIASLALASTVLISSLYIRERDPRLEGPPKIETGGILSFFQQVFSSMKRLPPQVRKVCEVQFFNWIGWFPFLFYITTYIGQLDVNPYFEANPDLSEDQIDKAWENATRIGTFALLVFAITSFSSNMLLPLIIVPTYRPPQPPPSLAHHEHIRPSSPRTPRTPITPGGMSTSMSSFFPPVPSDESHSRLSRLLSAFQIPWLTLRRAWLLSHLLFAACMFSTFFITTATAATVLVGVIGLAWALTVWAPFALISAEISKRDAARRARNAGRGNSEELDSLADEESEDQAGVILGLHNVSIAAPQIIATLVSSAIFKLAQRERGVAGDDSVGWVLRFGGLAALIAAYMTSRVGEEANRKEENGESEV